MSVVTGMAAQAAAFMERAGYSPGTIGVPGASSRSTAR